MNKAALRDAILAQLRRDLATQVQAAHLARDEAISEESRPENKYDTHSQEAAYLAEGQARIAAEIEESITHYAALPLPSFRPNDAVALGAVVETAHNAIRQVYFIGPRAGGIEISVEDGTVLVVTPQSPLGRQLLGKRLDDEVQLPGRGAAARQKIVSIR